MSDTQNNSNQQPMNAQIAPGGMFVLPDLFWAAVIFAALNMILVIWFLLTPKLASSELAVHAAAPEELTLPLADKPSPFTPVVDERRYARRQPEKVKPVLVSTLQSIDADASWSTNTSLPSRGEGTDQVYVRGNAVYDVMEKQTEMPRMTAANLPRATVPVRHVGTQEVQRPSNP